MFIRAELAHRAQVHLDFLQLRFLIEYVVFRGKLADLIQVGMDTVLPMLHPPRRLIVVAFHALLACRDILDRCGWLIEAKRIQILTEWERLPILAVLPFPRASAWIQVALRQCLIQLLGVGGPIKVQCRVGFLGDAGEVCLSCCRKQHPASYQATSQPEFLGHT
jgi:hypothetical protein